MERDPAMKHIALLLATTVTLTGCAEMSERLSNVGKTPTLSAIENPAMKAGYKPVSMPMPDPQMADRQPNSLWRAGARAFFKDQRASKVGDLVTVMISIDDKAQMQNSTSNSRTGSNSIGAPSLLGFETQLNDLLPDAVVPGSLVGTASNLNHTGTGQINRTEKIDLQVAAVIGQLLPNGNMVLAGNQEVRVNNEVRVLQITGIIRPEDITSSNTISYEKIAEARVSYGGRGQLTDAQQKPYGSQIVDILSPF